MKAFYKRQLQQLLTFYVRVQIKSKEVESESAEPAAGSTGDLAPPEAVAETSGVPFGSGHVRVEVIRGDQIIF